MTVYVLQMIDPTYGQIRTIGIFDSELESEHAREEAELRMTPAQVDRGCFYRITSYEIGKMYY